MFENLSLRNFTAFKALDLDFGKGVNVYAGANGTGKTHIMKLLYALQKQQYHSRDPQRVESLDRTLVSVFCPDSLGRLVTRRVGSGACTVSAKWSDKRLALSFGSRARTVAVSPTWQSIPLPLFLPATDILGHSVRFIEAYEHGWADFDVTYRDLLLACTPGVSRGPIPEPQNRLLRSLRRHMTGTVSRSEAGRFYLKDGDGQLEFPLIAEGWRKLGMLWTLIRSGALTQSSVLFWDEPEANLNPGLVALVAEVICRMAAGGAQVHVATHSYAMIRELEFQATDHGADLSLFALERTASDGVVARPARRFAELTPNPILDAHERIYERTIRDALSG